jgi:3-methyladenine DNA glycosylase AlkD
MPELRAVMKTFLREHAAVSHSEVITLARALWTEPVYELRMAAVELLVLKGPMLEAGDLKLIERLLRGSHTWALVDPLAITVTGRLVARFPPFHTTLDRWSRDEDFWIRRASMLALLEPLRRGDGDFERFARYADAMLEEKEFFIRKSIGWVLREISKKRPGLVAEWLTPRAARASGVMVREAVKYLDPKQRDAILARYRG